MFLGAFFGANRKGLSSLGGMRHINLALFGPLECVLGSFLWVNREGLSFLGGVGHMDLTFRLGVGLQSVFLRAFSRANMEGQSSLGGVAHMNFTLRLRRFGHP